MRSSAAERTRPTLLDGVVVILILAGVGLLLLAFRPTQGNFLTVSAVLDSVTVAQFDLTGAQRRTIEVPDAPYPITLEVEDGKIRVIHSDCPSQDCVRIGWVSRSGGQIVCLPNHLVVTVNGSEEPEVDGAVG